MDKDRIAGAAKDVAGKVEGAFGDLTGDGQTQASGNARQAAGTVQNLYGQAKDAVKDAADTATSYAKDALDSDVYRDGTRAVTSQVKENPLGALLIAGGIGFRTGHVAEPPAAPVALAVS